VFIARAVCGVTHVTIAALFCSSSLLCISNSDWTTENEVGRSVSVNSNEEPAGEICHQYSSVVTAIIPYSCTVKFQYTLLGDYWECVRPARLSVLTWVPSSVPPGNNIQDSFLIGSATDTTLPLLLYPWGFQSNAVFSIAPASLHNVCPIQFLFLLFSWFSIDSDEWLSVVLRS